MKLIEFKETDESIFYTKEVHENYLDFIKKQNAQRELFLINEIIPKFKWYHQLLFRINKKFIRNIGVQVIRGNQWGVELYKKIWWMPIDY